MFLINIISSSIALLTLRVTAKQRNMSHNSLSLTQHAHIYNFHASQKFFEGVFLFYFYLDNPQ